MERWRALGVVILVGGCGASQDTGSTWPPSAYPVVDQQCLNDAREQAEAAATLPPQPSGDKKAPLVVAPGAISGKRISGSIKIVPDAETKSAIARYSVGRTCPSFKLCLDETGVPRRLEVLRPSCFPRYDAQIIQRAEQWRYSPYSIDGVAVAVCTQLTVCYRQQR